MMAIVLTVLAVIGVVLVLFAAAAVATRDGGELQPAPPDAADVLAPSTAEQVRQVRFSLAPRGYRMAEVDQVLDRLAQQLQARDDRIAELTGGDTRSVPDAPAVPAAAAADEQPGEALELEGGPGEVGAGLDRDSAASGSRST